MKSDLNIKILKLSIAEIVMQSGFERISEQALNILGDLFKFYSEQILEKIKKMNKDHSFSIKYLVDESSLPSYQSNELMSFLNTQLSLKKSLGVKEEDESLLHTLKVIPKSVDLNNVLRSTSSFNLIPNLKNGSSNLNLELDPEMEKFIKENLK
ncbi:hypothetical protein NBO_60g0012, partial [Nosema bombycis CQ1]